MEPFIAEIKLFGGNFAPRGWAFCDGQLLPISQYSALFSLLGTIYGGDGRTTFALPDLRGRVPLSPGSGPGLPTYREGEKGGTYDTILNSSNLPAHGHPVNNIMASSANATNNQPVAGDALAAPGSGSGRNFQATLGYANATPDISLNAGGANTGNTGNNTAFTNMQPYLAVHYIIALQGVYPSRS